MDDAEKEIQKAYGLILEQMEWRRWTIKNKCGDDVNKFDQEYPANDVDCFLVSGRPRFDARKLHSMLLAATDPVTRGLLHEDGSRVRLETNERGFLRIWKPPRMNGRYVIGGDVAEGLSYGDFSCLHVYDWENLDLVAEWHGHMEPDLFGIEACKVGKIYNNALVAIEVNKDQTVAVRMKNEGYPHRYYRQGRPNVRTSRKPSTELGWLTTSVTKPVMIDTLATAITEGANIPSKETVSEMMTFVYDDKGSMGAQHGCFDDRVIASAIAMEVRKRHSLDSHYPRG